MQFELTRCLWLTPPGIEPSNPPTEEELSLFYTNPIKSRLILHRAMTGLGSKWWPTTYPDTSICIFKILISVFFMYVTSAEALWDIHVETIRSIPRLALADVSWCLKISNKFALCYQSIILICK